MRTKKVFLNIASGVIVQFVSIIVGLIIPKLIISTYGSSVNGLISSTNQIVGYFGIIEGGVAAAAGASLYKPFAEKNQVKINAIMTAVKKFYQKTGIIFGIILSFICIIYPLSIRNQVEFSEASVIMISLSMISVCGYLFFNKYNMILVTDQKHYITLITSAVINFMICMVQMFLMFQRANIIYVVSVVPVLSLIRLFLIRSYIRSNYEYIDYKGIPDDEAIRQKWNALSMNISQMCKVAIPIIVLSLLYDLKIVSVYTIYALLFHVGSSMIEITSNSVTAIFGNILVKENANVIKRVYDLSETLVVMVVAILSGCFFCLTNSFISIYIGSNPDINYQASFLMISFIINEAILNLRFSSKTSIKAAGKLREARNSGLIEIVICVILTPLFCILFGFQAVLLGSIIAGLTQTVYLTKFSYHKILKVSLRPLYKKIIINIVASVCGIIIVRAFVHMEVLNFFDWIIYAVVTGIILSSIVLLYNYIFLNKQIITLFNQFKVLLKR